MSSDPGKMYQVFTVHDTRLEAEKSVVYVGITQRDKLRMHFSAVVREHLPDLADELKKERHGLDFRLQGSRMDKLAAAQKKMDLIAKYQALGSEIKHVGRGFNVNITISEEPEAVSQ